MEEKVIKVVKVKQQKPLEALNDPVIGQRYLYCRGRDDTKVKEGQVLEVSKSGLWIKVFDGQIGEWIHFEEFGVFEALDFDGPSIS